MNLAELSFSYIRRRPLETLLNTLLLALGVATIVVLLLFSHQFRQNLERNSGGVKVVIGAKGVERVAEISLNASEKKMFDKSVNAVRGLVDACKKIEPSLGKSGKAKK